MNELADFCQTMTLIVAFWRLSVLFSARIYLSLLKFRLTLVMRIGTCFVDTKESRPQNCHRLGQCSVTERLQAISYMPQISFCRL